MNEIDFSFIVCSNGYGHIKRVLSVANALLSINPSLCIAIIAKPQLIAFTQQQHNFGWNPNILTDTTATENETDWKNQASICLEQTERWKFELRNNSTLQRSKHIISDNHLVPLSVYPNCIVMGSFFWHQLYTDVNAGVTEHEEQLLQALHPPHLCLGDMVMPEAIVATQAVKLPWFCTKGSIAPQPTKQLLITGGGTAILNEILFAIVRILTQTLPEWTIWVDAKLNTYCQSQGYNQTQVFDFTAESFSRLGAVVCRPGIGILTDCIEYEIPAFTIVNEPNAEIIHNGKQFEHKGFGQNYRGSSAQACSDMLTAFLSNETLLNQIRQQLKQALTGGAQAAAQYLLNMQLHD